MPDANARPGSSLPWAWAPWSRSPAIRPKDEARAWQAALECPHKPPDAPACRRIHRQSWSAPGEYWSDNKDWWGWPKTIASNAQIATGHRLAAPQSNVVLRAFLA